MTFWGRRETPKSIALRRIRKAKRTGSTVLDLSDLGLTSVPREVCDVEWLRLLSLNGNQLTSLPERFGELSDLRGLRLDENQLTTIPEQVGELTGLTHLQIADNRLNVLPAWFADLTALTELYLNDNRLNTLPAWFGELTNLTVLKLDNNQITSLPEALGHLGKLEYLTIQGNPLDPTLLAKAEHGTVALQSYLVLTGGDAQYEVKLVFVGPGAVGKTCLLRCLQGIQPDAEQRTTHGIDIAREPIDLPHPTQDHKMIHLNCWDFGGQDVYEITHQFFFSRRSIYLVLWQPRLSNPTDIVDKWIELIRQRVGETARILVICTHAKTGKHAKDLDERALTAKYGDAILGFVEVDTFAFQDEGDDAPENRYGVAGLREQIAAIAGKLPEPFPKKFRDTRRALIALAKAGREWMHGDEFVAFVREHGLWESDAYDLAKLMDVQGHIVYHDADPDVAGDCSELVILKPEWLAKAIGKVLEHEATREASGILHHEQLGEIWTGDDLAVPAELHGFLLQLMDRFDVSYVLPASPDAPAHQSSLVPQLIKSERPKSLPWTPSAAVDGDDRQLSIVFDFFEPPRGLAPITIVHTHRYRSDQTLHWKRGVFLDYADYGTAFIELRERELWLSTRGAYPPHFLSLLIETIERMLQVIWPGVKKNDPRGYALAVPCYEMMDDGTPCKGRDRLDALWLDLKDGVERSRCRVCLKQRDVSRLALGFESHGADLRHDLRLHGEDVKREFLLTRNLIEDVWVILQDQMDRLAAQTWRLEKLSKAQLGQLAHLYKTFINAMETHRRDGPCLFSLVPDDKNLMSEKRRLTLWCEWPDGPHPCVPIFSGMPGDYQISKPRDWLVTSAPAITWMLKILKVAAPIGGAFATETAAAYGLDDVKSNIGLMEKMIGALPSGKLDLGGDSWDDDAGEGIVLPKGGRIGRMGETDLRVFHDFLRDALPDRSWGNLRRAHFKGEFLWLCPHHFNMYDASRQR